MSAANTYKASSPDRAPLSDPWAVQSDAAAHAHDRPAGAADTLRRHASAAASTVRVHLARVEAATEDELRLYLGRGFEAVCVLLALASISFALHAVLSQHTVLLSSVNAFTLALALAGIAHARQLERWGLARTLDMYCLFLATVQGRAALLVTLGFLQGTSNVWGWFGFWGACLYTAVGAYTISVHAWFAQHAQRPTLFEMPPQPEAANAPGAASESDMT